MNSTSSSSGGVWEGLGGPVRMDRPDFGDIDPTLESCCRREAESNRIRSALEQTLTRHDVAALAERRRRHVLKGLSWGDGCRCCYDPNSDGGEYAALMELRDRLEKQQQQQQQQHQEEEDEESDTEDDREVEQQVSKQDDSLDSEDDSDDEFDYLLDEDLPGENEAFKAMEERRRAQLEFALLHREVARQHGFGVHRQMHPARVLRAAGLGGGMSPPPAVVLHLVDPESMASASLDLYLEKLAETCRGTKFLRSGGRAALLMDDLAAKVLPRLRPDADMPELVAIRDGVVIAVCPHLQGLVDELDGDSAQVVPSAVQEWLDRAGVLLEQPPPLEEMCRIRPEEEVLLDHLAPAREQELRISRYDCGIPSCRKTFPHEHVGMQNEKQDGLVIQEEQVVMGAETSA